MDKEAILYEQGLAFAEAGQLAEARAALKGVYELNPARTDAICALARIEREQGDLEAARTLLSELLKKHPADAGISLELGCLFHETGQLEFALRYYRDALKAKPDLAEGWHMLGRLFQQLEKPPQALEAYTHALELDPDNARCWNSLGLLHYLTGETAEARKALQQAVSLHPEIAEYHLNLAMAWLQESVIAANALKSFEMALRLKPEFASELVKIADHFFYEGRTYLASSFYRCALNGLVDRFEIYVKLAQCAERECEMQQALDYYHKALELKPDQWLLQIRAALLLPLIYQSPEDVQVWRQRFSDNLEYLHDLVQREKLPRAVQTLSLYSPAFLLAYQGIENHRLLTRLSELWRKLFALPTAGRNRLRTKKRRIGIVSAFFFDHSISSVYLGLVRELKARGHDLTCFAVGVRKVDEVTQELQELAHWQLLAPDLPLPRLAEKIVASDIDVLIFPEIGLDPLTYFLAHGRLAPVQVQLFGHPVSSGIATVDYFVSSSMIETENAQEHYSETLIQLPRVPFLHKRPELPQPLLSRAELGLPEGRIYFVPGMLFKLHPNHDPLFASILQQDEEAHIVMIQPAVHFWQDKLWKRFERSLGPWLDRVHFLPWMPQEHFYSLLLQADAALDTVHFCAGNVAYQAFGLGVPLVTLPGSYLRSRTTYGLYEQIGMLDLVANSWEEYSDLALRLARDTEWQQQMRQKVYELATPAFDDAAIMAELADFIEKVQIR